MTGVRASNPENRECRKFEDLLEQDPPVIKWEHNGRGVQIAVLIDDPHADTGYRLNKEIA